MILNMMRGIYVDPPAGTDAPGSTPPETLNSIIAKAASEVAKEATKSEEKVETKVETKVEVKDEKKTEVTDEKKDELDETQLGHAKTLFKALNNPDPKIQRQTLDILARAAGLDLKDIETKAEVKEAKATLVDLLKAELQEYDFLAEKLGPVLEKVIKNVVEESTKDIREEAKQSKLEKVQATISTAIDTAFGKFDNALEVKAEVVKLMDQFKPTADITHEDYFTSLIYLAAKNKGVELKAKGSEKTVVKDEKRIDANRRDVGSRLASERGVEVKTAVKTPGKMNLSEAVSAAVESLASDK